MGKLNLLEQRSRETTITSAVAQRLLQENKMKTVLHELLAVEKHRNAQVEQLTTETLAKFGKYEFFAGAIKTLKMVEDNPANAATEAAARAERTVPTTVHETFEYLLGFWANAEDVQYQKNLTNQKATGMIELEGLTLPPLPVDELLGLEVRLEKLRQLAKQMPSLNAAKTWEALPERKGLYKNTLVEDTTKTEKEFYPIILAPATDKHPAQVKEGSRDKVVGRFSLLEFSGAATTEQKARFIEQLDDLLAAVKQARQRANTTEVEKQKIGEVLVDYLMKPFK